MARAAFTKTAVGRMLDASPQPAYLLDEKRRIVFANQALANWLQVELDSLFRQRCDYHSEVLPDSALRHGDSAMSHTSVSILCPPPAAFAGESVISTVRNPNSQDSCEVRKVSHTGIVNSDGAVQGVLSVFVATAGDPQLDTSPEYTPDALHDSLAKLRASDHARFCIDGLIGNTAAMHRVRERVQWLGAPPGATTRVMVSGPGGTGKEHVARTIHNLRTQATSEERAGLVPLSCDLLDAELLGTTVTSFVKRCAELESSQTPSLLLLDVDRLIPEAQDELQGFLAIEEIGIRTICTSTSSYAALRQRDDFRPDLADTLAVFEICLPAVCERAEDIPLLIQYFVEKHNAMGATQCSGFSTAALEQCFAYPWPGNVAEIERVTRQCASDATGPTIQLNELPAQIRLGMDAVIYPAEQLAPIDLEKVLEDFERQLITKTLRETKQNKAETARRLGMNRAKLLRRISHLGLD